MSRIVRLSDRQFYLLSFTWGILYTAMGLLVACALLMTGHKAKRWGRCLYFEAGKKPWGGMEWGLVFVCDRFCGSYVKDHECGHAVQNCVFGPLMPFVIAFPSALRYWARRIRTAAKHPPKTDYYGIWFERQASDWGRAAMEDWRKNHK